MKLDLKRIEEPFVMELVNASGNNCLIDANPSLGGKNKGFRPMELLAGSLAACISIDVLNILRKQRIPTDKYQVQIEAVRKTAVPSPFESIHLLFRLQEGIDRERLKKNIELTIEKYCSVAATLNDAIQITYTIELFENR